MTKRQFGVSTHLYRAHRLGRDHLLDIAAHGFESVEVVAAEGHFDYRNTAAVADLQQWLAEAQLELSAVAVPKAEADAREDNAEHALYVARRIPVRVLIVAVGAPREAARLVDRLAELAAPLGVTVAVDSRSESMTPIGSLVHFVERAEARVGVALDLASAGALGAPKRQSREGGPASLADAIEMASEHLAAARVPIEGSIDWASVMTTLLKVGYDGPLTFDAPAGPSESAWGWGPARREKEMLTRAKQARAKMERWLTSI